MSNIVQLRKLGVRPEQEIELLHSPFYPAEVYDGEKAHAILRMKSSDLAWMFRIWRISPLGVELVVDESQLEASKEIRRGDSVELSVVLGPTKAEFSGLVVAHRHNDHGRDLVGIRWCSQSTTSSKHTPAIERRQEERWLCGVDFLPTGIAANPARFNDFVHFRVRDISKGGMHLLTSLRNKYLIPGMKLDAVLSLPMVGEARLDLQISSARILAIDGRDYLSLGTKYVRPDQRVLSALGQYVFQFGPPTTVKALKESGFIVPVSSAAMEFGYVRTEGEYREVLELRRQSYVGAQKMAQDASVTDAGDMLDARARILTVRYRGELVASARLLFHEAEDTFEHEEFLELPEQFPRKDQIVEITRVCTHPEYRGSDLFFAVNKFMALTVAQSGRDWMLGSADEKLVGFYEKIGWSRTGIHFEHGTLKGVRHELLLGSLADMISGRTVGVAMWNRMYEGLSSYLKGQDVIEFDPMMNLRMLIYRGLGAFVKSSSPPRKLSRSGR